ncbi:MAG: MotA/TolQ/ExbB proton channel family protein [Chromatiaceae bacterium]|nr:MotA/TolQ/ExbB proton channel family protein [Gammaproteobacteria bacterium]MCB1880404.1 MotA/TolQ/ExbB proton channel family protein [Gammaproteobacteria bacterium]MCB1905670.1 MotA/TolQ/ExbB proton channel family protein [Gammaproteobacteria bacterium]MCP5446413.1 MotA/TolQ/ExbB proton channel family protein [Chromatiaceae bacterium]
MHQKLTIGLLCAAVLLSSLTLTLGATSIWLVAISGFFFVIGGTLIAAVVSEGYRRVDELLRRLPALFTARVAALGVDEETFLQVATCYRRGSVRQAEMFIKAMQDPYLTLGSQLIVDRCSQKELNRALQWQLSNNMEQKRRRLRILNGMAGFAPAFGMLGTLLGLINLLFNLGDGGLDVVGAAMGFAMITTVYGLVAANLIIKPMAIKMEQRFREQLAWQSVKHELLMLLFEKAHPEVIRETLNAFITGRPLQLKPENASVTTLARA